MKRVVVDTNVIVSALLRNDGNPALAVSLIAQADFNFDALVKSHTAD